MSVGVNYDPDYRLPGVNQFGCTRCVCGSSFRYMIRKTVTSRHGIVRRVLCDDCGLEEPVRPARARRAS